MSRHEHEYLFPVNSFNREAERFGLSVRQYTCLCGRTRTENALTARELQAYQDRREAHVPGERR
jgi:hypothetical protein